MSSAVTMGDKMPSMDIPNLSSLIVFPGGGRGGAVLPSKICRWNVPLDGVAFSQLD